MKTQALLFSFLIISASFAQDLHDKISNNAFSVIGINGGEILEKVSLDDINKSALYDEMMKKFYRGGDSELIKGLNDFGVDYSKAVYYVEEFGNTEEEVDFKYLCYHIKDLAVFENAVKEKMKYKNIEKKGELNVISYSYYNKLYWNGSYALLIQGNYSGSKYDYYRWNEENYYGEATEEAVEEVYFYDENPIDTITAEDLEKMSDEEWQAYLNEQEEKQRLKEEEEKKKQEEKERRREERLEMKQRTVTNALNNRAEQFFSDDLKAKGNNLKAAYDASADAYMYFSGSMSIVEMLTGRRNRRRFPMSSFMDFGSNMNGNYSANFYLNETSVNLDAEIKYDELLTDTYSKMFKSKLDKKFINYISEDDMGYMTYSINSEDFWNAYPKFLEQSFRVLEEGRDEEWSLISDIISLIIDEEALADAITGDAVFILNGMSVKNVTYTSWEYDEEFNYNSTEKTKEELVPDFTFLFGSKEEDLIQKVFRLGVKNELIRAVEGGYQTGTGNFMRNTDYFVSYANEIVIITNSKDKLAEFNTGKTKNKIGGDRAKQIKKNPVALYLDTESLFSNLMYFQDLGDDDRQLINMMKEDMSKLNAKMYFSNDVMKFESTADVPSKYKNGAEYLLQMIGNGIKALK